MPDLGRRGYWHESGECSAAGIEWVIGGAAAVVVEVSAVGAG